MKSFLALLGSARKWQSDALTDRATSAEPCLLVYKSVFARLAYVVVALMECSSCLFYRKNLRAVVETSSLGCRALLRDVAVVCVALRVMPKLGSCCPMLFAADIVAQIMLRMEQINLGHRSCLLLQRAVSECRDPIL